MAQIFISHSAKDTKPLQFLNRAFASTNVQGKYEEIEAILSGRRTAAQIGADIASSNAIMVVLGPNAENLKHTRDWIVWESGNAAAGNKDIWILEPFEDFPKLSIVIPHLRHYVSFDYTDHWLAYLRTIINSYDDSHVLKTVGATAGLGALIGGEGGAGAGAVIGGLAGLLLAANLQQQKPSGIPIRCAGCGSSYSVHITMPTLRCPVCNVRLQFSHANAAGAGS